MEGRGSRPNAPWARRRRQTRARRRPSREKWQEGSHTKEPAPDDEDVHVPVRQRPPRHAQPEGAPASTECRRPQAHRGVQRRR
eukprot:4527563-Alexandrium_andersonii.AAC.1